MPERMLFEEPKVVALFKYVCQNVTFAESTNRYEKIDG